MKTFSDLLEPEVFERFLNLVRNDIIVRAWYMAISNPEHQMPQDANTLMWLVDMLATEVARLRQGLIDCHRGTSKPFSIQGDPNEAMLQLGKAYQDAADAVKRRNRTSRPQADSKQSGKTRKGGS